MAGLSELRRFMEVMAYSEQPHGSRKAADRALPFVTISRQAGAGGHAVAEALVAQLDTESDPRLHAWRIYDQALCTRMLEEHPSLHLSLTALLCEEYQSPYGTFVRDLFPESAPQECVYSRLFKMIRQLARSGKAVFVGRAAGLVTRGMPGGVHVRLVAPEGMRVKRMMDVLGTDHARARLATRTQDVQRARMVRDFFNENIDNPLLYDAVYNTGEDSYQEVAEAILALIKRKSGRAQSLQRN